MSVQLPPYRPVKRRSGLRVMGAALHALLLRELQTRFGGYRLGYLWALIDASLQVGIYLVIFGSLMKRVLPGMDYRLFLVAGLVPFQMLSRTATRALGAVDANRGLLMYRSVRHIDVVLARSFLELIIYFTTFVILVGVLAAFGVSVSLSSLQVVLFCWVSLYFFSFGLALVMMIVGHYGGEISKIVSLVFNLLYFVSGVLYSIHIVPEPYLSYLLYNPFIHNFELMRHALSPTYPNYHINIWYFLGWTVCVNFLGLLLYRAFERDLIRSR